MSNTFRCGCGKVMNVKDEHLGKRMKCPQCGATFTATRESSIIPRGSERAPRFHVSRGILIYACIAVAIPSILAFWKFGPGRVLDKWAAMEADVKSEVESIISQGMQAHLAQQGLYNPEKVHNTPHAHHVTFVISPMPLTMPEKIGFAGNTTEGAVVGRYFPATGLVEAEVEIGGLGIPGVTVRRGETRIKVSGHEKVVPSDVQVDGTPIAQLKPRAPLLIPTSR